MGKDIVIILDISKQDINKKSPNNKVRTLLKSADNFVHKSTPIIIVGLNSNNVFFPTYLMKSE